MGYHSWKPEVYRSTSATLASKPREEVFTSRQAPDQVRIENIEVRESRDSENHPNSIPIIAGLDVSGSMGFIAEEMAKRSLGPLMEKSIEMFDDFDPHVCFAAYGDADAGDRFPIQATQFEADTSIVQQLTSLYLEGQGGGNSFESNDLVWAFASQKTVSDAWEKRNRKGYVFTIGDEPFPKVISSRYYASAFPQSGIKTPGDALKSCQERYNTFHVIIEEGRYARNRLQEVQGSYSPIGKRLLSLSNHKYISQLIVSAIAISEGMDRDDAIDHWQDAQIREVIDRAIAE